jgi:CDP-glycerol glycerophosphotransferase
MPRISVVVPVYNVERYLAACLRSVAAQTVRDLEVVVVDDGSTDGSRAIAAEIARRDDRFRLVTQANGGLGSARNTGADAASGEFLAFLDSDDALPPDAYERLLGALERTGSDFASGNVHRLTSAGVVQAPFLSRAFARTRLRTHVTRTRALLADRTAWNKLWRRSFWDQHGLRFPEGVVHEDIPVVLPAHLAARSVDVVSAPVYLYRVRDDGEASITQRRLEPRVLLDRLAAVEHVRGEMARRAPRRVARWYDESLVADDLRLHLNVLDQADDAYRALFVDRVNELLDGAHPGVCDGLPAIDRLKWHLVRRRLVPELLEVLRFQREDLARTPPVRVRGRWYADYPFREDPRLRIPRSIYRLDGDLPLAVSLEALEREGETLRLRGHAAIAGIGAPSPGSQRLSLSAVRRGRAQRLRVRAAAVPLPTRERHRPEAEADGLGWSGFEAILDPRALRGAGRWELYAHARAGGLSRRRSRFGVEDRARFPAVDLRAGEMLVRALVTPAGGITVDARRHWALVERVAVSGDALKLAGEARLPGVGAPTLELRRRGEGTVVSVGLEDGGPGAFRAHVPLADLRAPDDAEATWELWAVAGEHRLCVALAEDAASPVAATATRETELHRTPEGDATLVERDLRPIIRRWRLDASGALELTGQLPPALTWRELILVDPAEGDEWPLAVRPGVLRDAFEARLAPEGMDLLARGRPRGACAWTFYARATGRTGPIPVRLALDPRENLPPKTVIHHHPTHLTPGPDDQAILTVESDLRHAPARTPRRLPRRPPVPTGSRA